MRSWRCKINSRKVMALTDCQYRTWDLLLCLTDAAGNLPSIDDMSFHMRLTRAEMERRLVELVDLRFIDPVMDGAAISYRAHDWQYWQRKWDCDPTNAERQKRHRERKKTSSKSKHSVTVTGSVTESVTEKRSVSVSTSEGRILSATRGGVTKMPYHEKDGG